MKFRLTGMAWIATLSLGNGPSTQSLELDADRPLVTITIDGRQTVMEVAPDGPNSPIVNAEVATELGKKGSLVNGRHMVGRTAVSASSNMARIDYGDGDVTKNRIFWFERDWTKVGEGRMGPGLMPQDIVTYRLSESQPNEQTIALPFVKHGRAGYRSETVIDDITIPVILTFDRPETMVTASTGALMASFYGGQMSGDPRDIELEMSFMRPARSMEFAAPIMIGELALSDVVVRTTDTGSTANIPDKDQDPNEIVVTAKSKRKPLHGIFLGTASFANCSTLTFDKKRDEIRLTCV
ncbi:hypothetical protein N9D37_00580 [Erythrobacter sp.]|nr:hypothetical protein [Erythrobacter sp.]